MGSFVIELLLSIKLCEFIQLYLLTSFILFSGLGIPDVKRTTARTLPPSRPPPPMKSPAPARKPLPKAGVISIPTKTAPPPEVPPPLNVNNDETGIYEEIIDDIVSAPEPQGPPPPPPRPEPNLPPLPQRGPPPVPARSAPPPPLPARPR